MFGVHGALWGNAMTWWDHDTGSIWSQPLGEAIAGPRTGETLDLLPVTFTEWGSWREAHPDTQALVAPAAATGFDIDEFLIVVDFTTEAAAYAVADVQRVGVVNDTVAGLDLAVITDPADPSRWQVFSRRLDPAVGQELTIELAFDDDRLVDDVTGSVWDPVTGQAVDGPRRGEFLDRLPALTSFPGDYDTFWPDGRRWTP